MEDNNDRFNWKLNDMNFRDKNGKSIKNEELYNFFEQRKKENTSITKELKPGDIIRLKLTNDIVTIYKLNIGGVKYAGYIEGETDLTLFGQEDIEEIIEKKISK